MTEKQTVEEIRGRQPLELAISGIKAVPAWVDSMFSIMPREEKLKGASDYFYRDGPGSAGTLGAFCGVVFGFGLGLACFTESWLGFGLYLMFMGWFHWSEWWTTGIFAFFFYFYFKVF